MKKRRSTRNNEVGELARILNGLVGGLDIREPMQIFTLGTAVSLSWSLGASSKPTSMESIVKISEKMFGKLLEHIIDNASEYPHMSRVGVYDWGNLEKMMEHAKSQLADMEEGQA